MPLLAARQWLLSRGASAPALASCRPAIATTTRRCYAQGTTGSRSMLMKKSLQTQPSQLHAATVIPHSINQDDHTLLSHIRPLPKAKDNERLCLILVTPSFAPKLLDDDFMGRFIYRIFGQTLRKGQKRIAGVHIEALCAVVDKLPVGRPIREPHDLDTESARRNHELPAAASGYEGFSYVSLPATSSAPLDSPSSSASSGSGAIDFITSAVSTEATEHDEVLRLPLANTVFQTGTTTTMFRFRYETVPEGPSLQKVSKTRLSHYQIRLNASPAPETRLSRPALATSLNIPLLPLTTAQHVTGCMGNIIRRIIDSRGHVLTAAAELEKAVPAFFQARSEPAQAITAWALVMPSSLHSFIQVTTRDWLAQREHGDSTDLWEGLWRSDSPVWTSAVANAIFRGARLHRVLSGGGGWGEKAGLIALDPVPVNAPSNSSSAEEVPNIFADPKDFASTLTPVVNDGDLIQFFVQPASYLSVEAARYDSKEQLKTIPEDGACGWELGTIPSTVDSIPGKSWQHSEPVSSGASIFKHSFGALTEGPLTLTKRILDQGDSTNPFSTTTLDVPFTRFWKSNTEARNDVSKKIDEQQSRTTWVSLKGGEGEVMRPQTKKIRRKVGKGVTKDVVNTTLHEANKNDEEQTSRLSRVKGGDTAHPQSPLRLIPADRVRRVLSANIANPPVHQTQLNLQRDSPLSAEQSNPLYKALKNKHRSLHRHTIRLTDEYNAALQILANRGIALPKQTLIPPQRRWTYRTLNAQLITLQRAFQDLVKEYSAVTLAIRRRNEQTRAAIKAQPTRPSIRKVKRITYPPPSSLIKQATVLMNKLARLATFACSLLFHIAGSRGVKPILRRRGVKVMGMRSGQRMWIGLGVSGAELAARMEGRRGMRIGAKKSGVRRQVRIHVRKVGVGRLVRTHTSASSVGKREGGKEGEDGGKRIRRTYTIANVDSARIRSSPRRGANQEHSEDKRREGARRLEELAKSWLL